LYSAGVFFGDPPRNTSVYCMICWSFGCEKYFSTWSCIDPMSESPHAFFATSMSRKSRTRERSS
jgi:hypothetical protein